MIWTESIIRTVLIKEILAKNKNLGQKEVVVG